jgi:hypothetical protein
MVQPRAVPLPPPQASVAAAGAFGLRRHEEETPDDQPVLVLTNELPRHTVGITLSGPRTYHRVLAPRSTIVVRLLPGEYEVRASGTTVARSAAEQIEAPYGTWSDTFEGHRCYRIWLCSRPLVPTRPAPKEPGETDAGADDTDSTPDSTPEKPVVPVPEEPTG